MAANWDRRSFLPTHYFNYAVDYDATAIATFCQPAT